MSRVLYPVTEERKALFLRELARTGSECAAARAASPHALGKNGGLESFASVRKRDPEFAQAWQEAKEAALAGVEEEIRRRAMEPPKRPVWHRGEHVGEHEDRSSSDKLLLRLAERLDPSWSQRSVVESSVTVAAALLAIRPDDVMLLNAPERREFVRLLGKIADLRGEDDEVPGLPGEGSPETTP